MRRVLSLVLIPLLTVAVYSPAAWSAGRHQGENNQFSVDILFSGQYGNTHTYEKGTTYNFWGLSIFEPTIYPPKYWGFYPLYFWGTRVGVKVRITNHGPRNRAKFRIINEAHVLRTDGSNGVALMNPKSIEADLLRNETKIIDASFTVQYVPGAESGLDRFLVKVLHVNNGKGNGSEEPGLITVREGVFCPPEIVPRHP